MNDFMTFVERAVQPIHATAARKREMREEMLTHIRFAYDEELRQSTDARAAADAALRRFGNTSDLQLQLQASVPLFERLVFCFLRKETLMSAWPWMVCWFAILIVMLVVAPGEMRPALAAVALIGAVGVARLTWDNHTAITRWLGPRWGWRALAIAFGPSIILPALAKLKHAMQIGDMPHDIVRTLVVALILGSLIVFIGLASTAHAVATRRRTQPV